jgi:hypothetical protein
VEAISVIGGVERKINFFAMDLPHSDAIFVVDFARVQHQSRLGAPIRGKYRANRTGGGCS